MAKIPPLIQGAKCFFRVLFLLWKCTMFTNLLVLWKHEKSCSKNNRSPGGSGVGNCLLELDLRASRFRDALSNLEGEIMTKKFSVE
jgi:hypothetical protein